MSHGLLWLPLLFAFVLLASLGWLERRRQTMFRSWAKGSELAKLDGSGGAPLTDESQGPCRLRLVGKGLQMDVPFADAERARNWGAQLMAQARCDL